MPLTFVNSHDEPDNEVRSVDAYATRTVAVAPSGSKPPSGKRIVWPLIRGVTRCPSTVTVVRRMPPSFAAIVLSSTRSIRPPDSFVIVAVESTRN